MYVMISLKRYVLVVIFAMALVACKTTSIPIAYNFTPKEVKYNPYGCWANFSINQDSLITQTVAGELLTISNDTVYLLIADAVVKKISTAEVVNAELYTHQNQAGKYLISTGILLLPNIIGAIAYAEEGYSGAFLLMGVPVTLGGGINAAIEHSKGSNILRFPSNHSLQEFSAFARYPAEIPPLLSFEHLQLKK